MAPISNGQVIFKEIPKGFPELGKTVTYDTKEEIDLERVCLEGGILIKTLDLAVDPYMRMRMRESHIPSFLPAFAVGDPLNGFGVGRVLRSENAAYQVNDYVYGFIEYKQYSVHKGDDLRVIDNAYGLPWSTYLGVLGMPGKSAYFGWKEYSEAKEGENVFVSTGAGAVGSLVIQLAKMDGLRIIASAGSEDKVQFMKDIGADVAFDYNTTKTLDVLKNEGGIDIFWDNVGGEILDNAFVGAKTDARFIECGMISGYNVGHNTPLPNIAQVFMKSLTLRGFIVDRLRPKYDDEFYDFLSPLVASGIIKHREEVTNGLENFGEVFLGLLKGKNKGKTVIHVSDN